METQRTELIFNPLRELWGNSRVSFQPETTRVLPPKIVKKLPLMIMYLILKKVRKAFRKFQETCKIYQKSTTLDVIRKKKGLKPPRVLTFHYNWIKIGLVSEKAPENSRILMKYLQNLTNSKNFSALFQPRKKSWRTELNYGCWLFALFPSQVFLVLLYFLAMKLKLSVMRRLPNLKAELVMSECGVGTVCRTSIFGSAEKRQKCRFRSLLRR